MRGEEYLQKRKFQEAIMEFRAAADIDKYSAEAHWGLARAYENLGQFIETVEELQQVAALNPDNLPAKSKLGNYFLLTDPPQTDEAQKILDDILTRDANFIEGHILKASLLSAQKRPEQEIFDVFKHALALNPNRTETYLSLSRFFMKLEKPGEAEKAIQQGISVNQTAAVGFLEYGRFLDYTNRPDEAEKQFQKAIEVEPKNIEARESMASFYLAQRQFEKAETVYKELVQIQENSPESRMALADFYALTGREDEAVSLFNGILADMPEYVRARYRLGEIYLERNENEKVKEQIEALLSFNDKDIQALMLSARVKLQNNEAEEALKDLEEILKKEPSQKDALFYMTQARLALGQIDQARAFTGDLEKYHPNFLRTKLLKIQTSFSAGEPEKALQLANELYETAKNSYPSAETNAQQLEDLRIRAMTARGLANLELGRLQESRTDLQKVQTLSPKSVTAMINLAKLAAAERNFAEALSFYEKALMIDSKNFDALTGSVNVLKRQKQFSQAHAKISQAIQENSGRNNILAALHYLRSDVFTTEGNTESAEAELKTAIQADENYLPAYAAYAVILVGRDQTDAAIEQYRKVVERKPSAAVYTLIGILEDARNNFAQAETNYRKALEIMPETSIAANNLAWLIADKNQGNLDEAVKLAEMTVSKNPKNAGFYDTLGWVYLKRGFYPQAVEQFKKAVAIDEAEAARTGQKPNPAYRSRLVLAVASAGGDKTPPRTDVQVSLR